MLANRKSIIPNGIAQESYFLSLAETTNVSALDIIKMARHMFLRIVLVLRLVSLIFLVCFSSIRTEFSSRRAGELHTKETVKKAWWQGTKMICITTAL